jgi:hypothetical protein
MNIDTYINHIHQVIHQVMYESTNYLKRILIRDGGSIIYRLRKWDIISFYKKWNVNLCVRGFVCI